MSELNSLPGFSKINLLLASASPRRKALLESCGLSFIVVAGDIDESRRLNEPPNLYAKRMAREKADQLAARYEGQLMHTILAADTIVVIDDDVLGKPQNIQDAKAMLLRLSGRSHLVITAFTLIGPHDFRYEQDVTTDVLFKALRSDEIDAYLSRSDWKDKAGAYAIQDEAAYMVAAIRGSYTNVVGLPLCEVIEALEQRPSFVSLLADRTHIAGPLAVHSLKET